MKESTEDTLTLSLSSGVRESPQVSARFASLPNSVNCLVETGSVLSLLPKEYLTSLGIKLLGRDIHLKSAAGEEIHVHGQTNLELSFQARLFGDCVQNLTSRQKFLVHVADISTGPIVGADFLEKYGIEVNFKLRSLCFSGRRIPLVV